MSAGRTSPVKEVFLEALELDPQERARFLAERCGDDSTLRADVEKLLAADSRVHTRFLAGALSASADRGLPERIAHFRILRRIGEGGMGSVFEAQQDHPRRKVALKIIRMAMASESVRRRFEYEVQILGQLKHPGIAQIYEAGTHDDGHGLVPYFAMELVQGRTLLEFARDQHLATRQRLMLMADICDAVHHAHQKGVVHRDLKPANILVELDSGIPKPKILDFGVARATHSDIQQATMHTEVGQLVGTLSYMSPEQVAGRSEDVDIRSDVYALGVILYELLADRLPYELHGHSIAEAGSIIRDLQPTRLSSVDTSLRGDIETIAGKALAKEKERRYPSAAEMAADIRRYLNDEPIVARPASHAYQLRKFARRNKALVSAIAAIFLTLVLGIIAVSVALVRATEAERVAMEQSEKSQRSAAKATAVNTFLQEMLASVDPAQALGHEATVRQALDAAAAKIDAGSLRDQPEIETELRTTIGSTYEALGLYPEAESQLRAAVDLARKHYGPEHQSVMVPLDHLALVNSSLGRFPEAEKLFREALVISRRIHGERSASTATLLQNIGGTLRSQHKYDEAERFYRDALIIRREIHGADHLDVAQSINSLALLGQDKGDLAAAEPLFREALAMRRRLLGEKHPVLAGALNNLAGLLQSRGKLAEAESLLREALDMRRALLGPEHPDVAQSLNNLGLYLYENQNYAEAESLYREALAIWRKTLPAGHPNLGNCSAGLGVVLIGLDKHAEAETHLRESLSIREATYPEGHWARYSALSALGASLAGQGKFQEAEPLLLTGYQGIAKQPGLPVKHQRRALERLVGLYDAWNKPDLGARWREEFARLDTAK